MANNLILENFFRSLESWGLIDVLLPFILVFTLVFAVLEKTMILGPDRKNFNVVIALVLGLSVVFPHITNSYPISYDPVNIINGALPSVSILVVAIMMLLIVLGVFAHDKVLLGLSMPGWIGFLSIVAIIFIFGMSAGWWGGDVNNALGNFFGEESISIVVMILVFGIIIAFITHDPKDTKGPLHNMGVAFDQIFGKK